MSKSVTLPSFLDRERILSIEQTAQMLGYSTAHLRRMYRTGKIKKPIQIGARKLGYKVAVVLDLINAPKSEAA